jgi:hypothetical protein
MNHRLLVVALTVGVALVTDGSAAFAQAKTDPTRRADQYYVAAAKTYNMHAHDHARMLGKYAAAADHPVPAEVVKEHTAAIGANVERARRSFAKLAHTAKPNPDLATQLAEIQKRLAAVTKQLSQLNASSAMEAVDQKLVLSQTAGISRGLQATHLASKKIDAALVQAADANAQFDDSQSDSYYFTGEGHFID